MAHAHMAYRIRRIQRCQAAEYLSVRCRDVSRGTSSQFEQPASCGWGAEWYESGAKLAVETEIFMYFYASSIFVRIHTLPQYKQFHTHSIWVPIDQRATVELKSDGSRIIA